MKNRATIGVLVRERRRALGLTQAELARELDVRPAYISIIEKNRRRPSLPLLHRMSEVLRLDSQQLFLLSHPEAKALLRRSASSPANGGDEAWRSFIRDKDLLARHCIEARELEVLAEIKKLGEVRHPRDFIQILTAIRHALKAQ